MRWGSYLDTGYRPVSTEPDELKRRDRKPPRSIQAARIIAALLFVQGFTFAWLDREAMAIASLAGVIALVIAIFAAMVSIELSTKTKDEAERRHEELLSAVGRLTRTVSKHR